LIACNGGATAASDAAAAASTDTEKKEAQNITGQLKETPM
jgi:hypothetical protein